MNGKLEFFWGLLFWGVSLVCSDVWGQSVVISEIVASNEDSLLDEDGEGSDWIELYNLTDSVIKLDGWYLTDDGGDLVKWRFPAVEIAANGFLVVFGSDKDRDNAGSELHTNFKLSADGETVILVRADGVTVEDALSFGELEEDISYGYAFEGNGEEPVMILGPGAACQVRVPTGSSDAAGWTDLNFNSAGWLSGTTGVGYDTNTDFDSLIGLDVQSVMRGVNESIYIRVPFEVENASSIASLSLGMKYDDGFVAFINGVEVARSGSAPSSVQWNSSSGNHSDSQAVVFEYFDLSGSLSALRTGENVLAIHGMNTNTTSSDLIFVPKLDVTILAGDIDLTSLGLLTVPSPGGPNSSVTYADFVETPVTSPERGFFETAFQATVSNVTSGAIIRYTLDGSEPTEDSPRYTGPVTISKTTNFRVRAFKEGWRPSYSRTDTYIFVDDVVTQQERESTINGQVMVYGMNQGVVNKTYYDALNQRVTVQDALKAIPTISITTDDRNLYGSEEGIYVNASERWEVPASAELINPDGSEGFQVNAGLRIRGGWSRHSEYPKHSFRLFFRDEYGAGKLNFPLFGDEGAGKFDKVDLRTAQNYAWAKNGDEKNTFLRDIFARDTAAAMGQESPRSEYYHLYLNGLYWGLFMTEERPVASFGETYYGGDEDDYDTIKVQSWTDPDGYAIEVTDGTMDAYERLYQAAMSGFSSNADYFAVQGLDASGQPDGSKEKLVDVDNLIDYLLVIYYTAASDNCITSFAGGYQKLNNMYAIYNRVNPDGFKWFQHDCEHSLDTNKNLDFTGPFPHANFRLLKYFNAQTLHEKLSVNEEYRIRFADRVYKQMYNGGALVRENSEARFDARAAQIDRAIVANAARWGNTRLDRDTWVEAVATAREFLGRSGDRVLEVIGYLEEDGLVPSVAPPSISIDGGEIANGSRVDLSATGGTIYYTLDGSDPRAIGGGVSGTRYSQSLVIDRPTQLKARCRTSNGEWSALAEATYWTPDIPLAITELMYHAPEGNPHDYIEVKNVSSDTVSLEGYTFDDGIEFDFKEAAQTSLAPGEILVAVDDVDAFYATYPTSGVRVAGEFSGDLDNGGEGIDLEFLGSDLISFKYEDARNWPQAADGAGHSLVPLDAAMGTQEMGSLNYGGNWRASTFVKGSPGLENPAVVETVVINEVTAHTDTEDVAPFDSNDQIELYNPTSVAVDLGGWGLSDDGDELGIFVIPSGTTVAAGGYFVFDEGDFHSDGVIGFGLNKAGEQVYLSNPGGHVVDSIRFKGQENGASWGRYPDGDEHWIATSPTPGGDNVPFEFPFRISELMYHPALPAGSEMEYIVIENISGSSALLENETGSYRIDGGVEFGFESGVSLAADEKIWLVSFDPTDVTQRNAFRSEYGLNSGNRIFGPYAGELSNSGERVALERPQESDDPEKPDDVSWVVVDELFYFDQAPWPTSADGEGSPLVRVDLDKWSTSSEFDSDDDGIEDAWELKFFGSLEQSSADMDGDRWSNYEEYLADTDPMDAASFFLLERGERVTLQWTAAPERSYSVYWTDDLNKPFTVIATGVTEGVYVDDEHSVPSFYKIKVELF